jgi:hypothetical protein
MGEIVGRPIRAAVLACAAAFLLAPFGTASAQTDYIFWISMRSFSAATAPSYVVASLSAAGQQTVALQACDGNTYYLAQADAATVQAALANQDTVQLNTGPQGSTPDVSEVLCLMQAAQ